MGLPTKTLTATPGRVRTVTALINLAWSAWRSIRSARHRATQSPLVLGLHLLPPPPIRSIRSD